MRNETITKKIETDDLVVFYSDKRDIDISEFKTDKDLILILKYPFTIIDAKRIEAKTVVFCRVDDSRNIAFSASIPDDQVNLSRDLIIKYNNIFSGFKSLKFEVVKPDPYIDIEIENDSDRRSFFDWFFHELERPELKPYVEEVGNLEGFTEHYSIPSNEKTKRFRTAIGDVLSINHEIIGDLEIRIDMVH